MKPQGSHAHEDRLLDFAYGELPPSEARVVEQHVQGCSRCSDALDGIRGVRTVMSRLPLHSAPEAGLESLLAYAQQSARRSAAGPAPAPRWWRRLLAPALGVAALGVFGVVVHEVDRSVELSPALTKQEAAKEQVARQEVAGSTAKDKPSAPAPVLAPVPAAAPVAASAEQLHEQMDERVRYAEKREAPAPKVAPSKSVRRTAAEDWSNATAGSAGGFPEKKAVVLGDENLAGLDSLGTKEAVKSKRGASYVSKNAPSVSTARPAKLASDRDDAPADAEAEATLAAEEAPATPGEAQVAQYVPPSPSQRISGSTSLSGPKGSASSYDDVRSAPGRAQMPASVPPPPPPVAQAQPSPEPATAGASTRLEGMSDKAEQAQQSRGKSAEGATRSVSPSELLRQADVAYRSGDRAQEAALLRGALTAGAQGAQRLEVLSRLCDAEFALDRRQSAIEFCKRVMRESPDSSEARMAQRRLDRELQSETDEAKSAKPASVQTQ